MPAQLSDNRSRNCGTIKIFFAWDQRGALRTEIYGGNATDTVDPTSPYKAYCYCCNEGTARRRLIKIEHNKHIKPLNRPSRGLNHESILHRLREGERSQRQSFLEVIRPMYGKSTLIRYDALWPPKYHPYVFLSFVYSTHSGGNKVGEEAMNCPSLMYVAPNCLM